MPTVLSPNQRLAKLTAYIDDVHRDLAVKVRIRETGEESPVFGGRWHLLQNRYLEPWEVLYQIKSAANEEERERAILDIHTEVQSARQAEFALDFTTPLIMANGSRRGGKSRGSAGKACLHVARFPGMGGELISPTYPKARIMWRYLLQVIPSTWIEDIRRAEMSLQFWNGAEVKFLSAYQPDSLVGEGVGWIGFDEFQSIRENAFALALPALSEGGSAFQCWGTGTPRMGEYRSRYERFIELQRDGTAKVLRFTYRDNPFIFTGAGSIFDIAKRIIDPRRRQQELEALFVSEEGLVYYSFDRKRNARPWSMPGRDRWAPDITEEFTQQELGVACQWVVGVDYGLNRQFAVVYKLVRMRGKVCIWAVGEFVLRKDASVETLGNEMIEAGYYPAAVCDDASGPKSKGGGDAAVRLENLTDGAGREAFHVFHYAKNPHVQKRVDAMNAMIGIERDETRWFVDPKRCPQLIYCIENQEIENGKPRRSPEGEESLQDLNDAAGYPVVYLFPADVDYEMKERAA